MPRRRKRSNRDEREIRKIKHGYSPLKNQYRNWFKPEKKGKPREIPFAPGDQGKPRKFLRATFHKWRVEHGKAKE